LRRWPDVPAAVRTKLAVAARATVIQLTVNSLA
jgi:hypothetical protein